MFKPVRNIKVYEQVIEQIKEMIADGTIKKGDKLPAERDLAEQLKVSRASVREALRALEVIGLVESMHGGGNYIRQNFDDSLFEPLSMMFMLEQSSPWDILELRKIIEIETAGLAAKNISFQSLDYIKKLLSSMKDTDNEEQNAAFDKEFHYEIARSSGNFLVINILNVISALMDKFIKDARGMILSKRDNWDYLLKQHEDIYDALARRDIEDARHAMEKHFEMIEKYYE